MDKLSDQALMHALEEATQSASPEIRYYMDTVQITMHNYQQAVGHMILLMKEQGFRLLSVSHAEHKMWSDSGREFWWTRESKGPLSGS